MKTKVNGAKQNTTQENITTELDKMSSGLVRWYAQLEKREVADVINGIIAERLEHLREGEETGFTDDTGLHIREGVMDAIDRRLLVEARPGQHPRVGNGGSDRTENAILHLQDAIAKRFGCDFETDTGAGTLFISHDGVSLTNPRSSIVALRAASAARELAKL
jgi:ribosomal protein S6E (S10)